MATTLTPRFIKIRKNYLTFINLSNILKKEVDQDKKMKLKKKCVRMQINSQLLLDLASDLSKDEKELLTKIKDKTI